MTTNASQIDLKAVNVIKGLIMDTVRASNYKVTGINGQPPALYRDVDLSNILLDHTALQLTPGVHREFQFQAAGFVPAVSIDDHAHISNSLSGTHDEVSKIWSIFIVLAIDNHHISRFPRIRSDVDRKIISVIRADRHGGPNHGEIWIDWIDTSIHAPIHSDSKTCHSIT